MRFDPVAGAVPEGWTVTTIGGACDENGGKVQTGPFGSQLHASDYVSSGTPSVMPKNISEDRISTHDIARVGPSDVDRLAKHQLQAGDIVYSRRGDVERRALVSERETGWLCGTGCLRVRLNHPRIASTYLYYYLGHPSVRAYVVRHAHGATMPNLNTSILRAVPLTFPPLREQLRIAAILVALDDKIELNRQMNRTLEEIAQTIFKSRFIDFDGVSPEDLVDSDLGPIPDGWRPGSLEEVASNVRDTVKPELIGGETPYVGLEHIPRRSATLDRWGSAANVTSAKAQFVAGDVLFGKLRPYFHKVVPAPCAGIASTDILVVRSRSKSWRSFTFGHLYSDALIAHATAASNGTRMPRTKWTDLCRFPIALPPEALAEEYQSLAGPIYKRLIAGARESQTLGQLRDALLPKLISGELRVPEPKTEEGGNQ